MEQLMQSGELSAARSRRGGAGSTIGDRAFKGLADLIKLLPSGTVFIFQFLNPLLTNKGQCHTVNKYLSGVLLALCGFSCCFSSFTDSYVGSDGRLYYGLVTKEGLWSFSDRDAGEEDLSKYRLRLGDFAHAALSLVVFAVISLLDSNTVDCFYPSFEANEKVLLMVLPTVVGGLASSVFMVFPNDRHGIGYAATQGGTGADASNK
ncbi:uncharacterized protein M6B38_189550 [Iris pallida]|uniref:Uncharacterized protein n=1 Tax=Iris pallida TaxID=29817 RepID=A0AAX6EID9_IRIPA|nr:uncharacterized protein M6B38_189550 [Iris pallida]